MPSALTDSCATAMTPPGAFWIDPKNPGCGNDDRRRDTRDHLRLTVEDVLRELDIFGDRDAAPVDDEAHAVAGLVVLDRFGDLVPVGDPRAADRHDPVAGAQARLLGAHGDLVELGERAFVAGVSPAMNRIENINTSAITKCTAGPAAATSTRAKYPFERYARGSSSGSTSSRFVMPMMRQ